MFGVGVTGLIAVADASSPDRNMRVFMCIVA